MLCGTLQSQESPGTFIINMGVLYALDEKQKNMFTFPIDKQMFKSTEYTRLLFGRGQLS